jgi:hypothetical protein
MRAEVRESGEGRMREGRRAQDAITALTVFVC